MIYIDDSGFLQYEEDSWEDERTLDLVSLIYIESSRDGAYYSYMGGCSE